MSTNNFNKTDLFNLHNIIQYSFLTYPKEVIIATLKDFFSRDHYYRYLADEWGFSKTVDMTDLPPGAGMSDNSTTRVHISEWFRFDSVFYPGIFVKNGGSRSVPISINRDQGSVKYGELLFQDGYGNQSIIRVPQAFVTAGAWEGSVDIEVRTRSLRSRDDLVQLIALCFTEITFDTLSDIGVTIKPIDVGAPSETDDRNDKLFRQTLSLPIRTEWRREIPIKNVIDTILFSIEFSNLNNPDAPVAQNLTINTEINLVDAILNI